MIHRSLIPSLLLAVTALAGCAGNVGGYPSLAPRAIEQGGEGGDIAPAPQPAPPAATPDPALTAQVATLVDQARRGDVAMAAALRSGCGAIGAGSRAAQGSEPWVAAQQALSRVEAERAPTAAALDTLEALVLARMREAESAPQPVDLTPLTDAAAQVAAIDAAQRARLGETITQGCRP